MTFSARSDRHFIRSTYRSNRFVLAEIRGALAAPAAYLRSRAADHAAALQASAAESRRHT